MQIKALPDITCTGAVAPLTSVGTRARWVQFITPSTNAAQVRIGGSEVSATEGLPIPPGTPSGTAAMFLPIDGGDPTSAYDLSTINQYGNVGDKLYVLYAT
jgi:hypothetical protein